MTIRFFFITFGIHFVLGACIFTVNFQIFSLIQGKMRLKLRFPSKPVCAGALQKNSAKQYSYCQKNLQEFSV